VRAPRPPPPASVLVAPLPSVPLPPLATKRKACGDCGACAGEAAAAADACMRVRLAHGSKLPRVEAVEMAKAQLISGYIPLEEAYMRHSVEKGMRNTAKGARPRPLPSRISLPEPASLPPCFSVCLRTPAWPPASALLSVPCCPACVQRQALVHGGGRGA
jgi:hypothetical protein